MFPHLPLSHKFTFETGENEKPNSSFLFFSQLALELYLKAIDILLPVLRQEPAGRRKVLLSGEVQRWLGRAEAAKKLLAMQEEALEKSMALEPHDKKNCKVS